MELNLEKSGNKSKINGFIRQINYTKLNTATKSEIILANHLSQLKSLGTKSPYDYTTLPFEKAIAKINAITGKSRLGTLVIVNKMDTYFACVKALKDIKNYELFKILNACGENAIVFAPSSEMVTKDYQNIFIMDTPITEDYPKSLSTKYNSVYCVDGTLNPAILNGIDASRHTFGLMLNAIKAYPEKTTAVPDIITYFNNLKRFGLVDKNLKYNEFIFFMLTMSELGICDFADGRVIVTDVKSNLENSKIYTFIKGMLKK